MSAHQGMLAVDVGGTFTDVIGVRDGVIHALKVATDRTATHVSVLEGARALGAADRTVFNHASTAGLNALLTRRLPKVGFLTTYGHRDMLDMARSFRPFAALTDAQWRKSFGDSLAPLIPRYLRRGATERIKATGEVLIALDTDQVRRELERFKRCNIEGLAICLINAYVNPVHEVAIRELAGEVLGDIPCSISSEVSPLAQEYPRATTTLIDAFMKIVYGSYAERLAQGLAELDFCGELNFADSAATLLNADYAIKRPFKLVFAGPAAGAVASAHFGALIGDGDLLCCDVGGTSSDMSIVAGGAPLLNTSFELEPDLIVNAPSIELTSLGAGGGSLVFSTPGGEIRVGPESAGGDPGPACYGRGGTAPTMTDAFLLIGLLDPDRFNAGALVLDRDCAVKAFDGLESPLALDQRIRYAYRIGLNNIAEGLLDVAVKRGIDPRQFSLVAYGAAGPLMLPSVLAEVRARRVIVPPYPGLFSALGLLSTNQVYSDSRTSYLLLTADNAPRIAEIYADMEAALVRQVRDPELGRLRRRFDGRLMGQSWETPFVEVPAGVLDTRAVEAMIDSFHVEYERRFGNRFEDYRVQAVTYRVDLVVPSEKVEYPELGVGARGEVSPDRLIELRYIEDEVSWAGEYERGHLGVGDVIRGPAIIREHTSTTHVLSGQVATTGRFGELIIEPIPS